MLTKEHFRYNFLLLGFLCKLKIVPLELNTREGVIKVQTASWKRTISRLLFGATVLHGLHIDLKLLRLLFSAEVIRRHHLVFHVDLALAVIMVGGWYVLCFVLYPETFVALFNEIFAPRKPAGTVNCTRSLVLTTANLLSGTTGLETSDTEPADGGSRSRQELLAIAMPFVLVGAVIVILLLFSYDRTLSFLLYSSLPSEYRTRTWFRILFLEEALYVVMLGSNGGLVLNTQLLFFEKLSGDLKRLKSLSSL